ADCPRCHPCRGTADARRRGAGGQPPGRGRRADWLLAPAAARPGRTARPRLLRLLRPARAGCRRGLRRGAGCRVRPLPTGRTYHAALSHDCSPRASSNLTSWRKDRNVLVDLVQTTTRDGLRLDGTYQVPAAPAGPVSVD